MGVELHASPVTVAFGGDPYGTTNRVRACRTWRGTMTMMVMMTAVMVMTMVITMTVTSLMIMQMMMLPVSYTHLRAHETGAYL
eukprot:3990072-Pyramimonas_sp.AAC.1